MKKTFSFLILLICLAGVLSECKDPNASISTGPGDPRIVGTWRLYERRFPKDSLFFVYTIKRDSVLNQDSVYVPRIDTVRTSRDTTFFTTKRYPNTPSQTLTFDAAGNLSGSGAEMTYYAPYKHYRVDKTYPDSLFIDLFIYTNGANVAARQALELQPDTLVLKNNCDQPPCYSKLLRIQ